MRYAPPLTNLLSLHSKSLKICIAKLDIKRITNFSNSQQEEIHVQPLTIKFITTAVSRVCEFEIEFGTLTLSCTMLWGYKTIKNTVEGFYWLSLIAITCR